MASAKEARKAASPLPKPPSEIANQVAILLGISADQAQQLLDIVSQAVSTKPEPSLATDAKTEANTEKEETEKVRASKHEFRILNEIWDEAARGYNIKESSKTTSKDNDEWVEYLFVLRRKFDEQNMSCTEYVDIKSEELRSRRTFTRIFVFASSFSRRTAYSPAWRSAWKVAERPLSGVDRSVGGGCGVSTLIITGGHL
ncbi:MAG: hypothetical protein M1840_000564 [Geoglossum simile]|nr:MAG: hypothetical protein M1840_000564 [Geoglossum simile]